MDDRGPREADLAEENRRLRLLRVLVDTACAVLRHRPLSESEAEQLVGEVRREALRLFPDKGPVFDLVYVPRFRRIVRERLRAEPEFNEA
ncbi:MAG: hypothetical protein KatS3mg076_2275 [Candidatus Binatia bacterium]|nr:MAG: hypothetical protein KatS3mg076_2275 [Candidatus Binatia bacterium]